MQPNTHPTSALDHVRTVVAAGFVSAQACSTMQTAEKVEQPDLNLSQALSQAPSPCAELCHACCCFWGCLSPSMQQHHADH